MMHRIALSVIVVVIATAGLATAQPQLFVPQDYCPSLDPPEVVEFELPQPGPIELVVEHVFEVGLVRTLIDGTLAAGMHSVVWDGRDGDGQLLDTGIYVFKLRGPGWEIEAWSDINCGYDASFQKRVIVDGKDVCIAITNIIPSGETVELAVYDSGGTTRLVDFSTLLNPPYTLFLWTLNDSLQAQLPAGDYIYRMTSPSYSEDIPFTLDPIERGALTMTLVDNNGDRVTGIYDVGDTPQVEGPLQQLEVGFGRRMSAAEIEYVLGGALLDYGFFEQARPAAAVVWPDSTGLTFHAFDTDEDWRDLWGTGSFRIFGMFEPEGARFQIGFDHQGVAWQDRHCQPLGRDDPTDWIVNTIPVYGGPTGSIEVPCNNPVLVGQSAEIFYETFEEGVVDMVIVDGDGNRVRRLVGDYLTAGPKAAYWDRLDDTGAEVPAGLYHLVWYAYYDWLRAGVLTSGDILISDALVDVPDTGAPARPVLLANTPNPFNPSTTISFELPEPAFARISVVSLDGKRVATLLEEQKAAGRHDITWSGRDQRGRPVPSGAYFYRLEAGETVDTRRMLLLK